MDMNMLIELLIEKGVITQQEVDDKRAIASVKRMIEHGKIVNVSITSATIGDNAFTGSKFKQELV